MPVLTHQMESLGIVLAQCTVAKSKIVFWSRLSSVIGDTPHISRATVDRIYDHRSSPGQNIVANLNYAQTGFQ
eukprot:scaffold70317_cov21-Prasinocladus_malaysianus.AAC.1